MHINPPTLTSFRRSAGTPLTRCGRHWDIFRDVFFILFGNWVAAAVYMQSSWKFLWALCIRYQERCSFTMSPDTKIWWEGTNAIHCNTQAKVFLGFLFPEFNRRCNIKRYPPTNVFFVTNQVGSDRDPFGPVLVIFKTQNSYFKVTSFSSPSQRSLLEDSQFSFLDFLFHYNGGYVKVKPVMQWSFSLAFPCG